MLVTDTTTLSGYRLDTPCRTEGCDGTPFFGETASPGFYDVCHVRRCDEETRQALIAASAPPVRPGARTAGTT